MAPKLEYQPIFGMEQVTPSEAAQNWTSLRLHNNCRLVRGDFNLLEIGGNSNPGRLSLIIIIINNNSIYLYSAISFCSETLITTLA